MDYNFNYLIDKAKDICSKKAVPTDLITVLEQIENEYRKVYKLYKEHTIGMNTMDPLKLSYPLSNEKDSYDIEKDILDKDLDNWIKEHPKK